MKKRVKVVMLPTENKSHIFLHKKYNQLHYVDTPIHDEPIEKNQHLYFLSDDEIKEGDYIYHTQMFNHIGFTGIAKVGKQRINGDFIMTSLCGNHTYYTPKEPKIIATTNETLGLPRPSNEFLKKYCELGGVNECFVEYEQFLINRYTEKEVTQFDTIAVEDLESDYKLKVSPDNTITIYRI